MKQKLLLVAVPLFASFLALAQAKTQPAPPVVEKPVVAPVPQNFTTPPLPPLVENPTLPAVQEPVLLLQAQPKIKNKFSAPPPPVIEKPVPITPLPPVKSEK